MPRWEPDAPGRLLRAALELFSERGYDATTAAQIADRAGLTKTTLFRLFPDKREIVFQGQGVLANLVAAGVADAPAASSALELVAAGLRALAGAHPQESRSAGRALTRIIASSAELRERAALKRSVVTAALEGALLVRTGEPRQAGVLADLGIRAYYAGYETWVVSDGRDLLADHVLRELAACEDAVRRAMGTAGR